MRAGPAWKSFNSPCTTAKRAARKAAPQNSLGTRSCARRLALQAARDRRLTPVVGLLAKRQDGLLSPRLAGRRPADGSDRSQHFAIARKPCLRIGRKRSSSTEASMASSLPAARAASPALVAPFCEHAACGAQTAECDHVACVLNEWFCSVQQLQAWRAETRPRCGREQCQSHFTHRVS